MSVPNQIKLTEEKRQEISEFLNSYWGNDIWDLNDSFFDGFRSSKKELLYKTIHFTGFRQSIKNEIKYMFACRLIKNEISLSTIENYSSILNNLAEFLKLYYPLLGSIVNIPYDKALLQWRTFLTDKGFKIKQTRNDGYDRITLYEFFFNRLYSFILNHYDTRDEYEKDVWDCRKIPGAKITESFSLYYLNFTEIPLIASV